MTITTIERGYTHTHGIDAAGGKVVDSATAAPSASATSGVPGAAFRVSV
ncbi:hypothetical protein ACF1B0_28640 [Streptomyces anandii]